MLAAENLLLSTNKRNTILENEIGPDGAKCISEGLKANSELKTLNIDCKNSATE